MNGRYANSVSICTVGTALACITFNTTASAESTGIVGRSAKQGPWCDACHSDSGVFGTFVTISGPTEVAPLSVNTYTVTISASTAAGATMAGFNAAASHGVVTTTDPFAQIIKLGGTNEVTHKFPPKSLLSDTVTYTFRWQAPAQPASGAPYTLYASANSANGSGTELGDDPERATPMVVTVTCNDADFDGFCSDNCTGAACDNCPAVYNPGQGDCDGDDQGDACDTDCTGASCTNLCLGTCGDGFVDATEDCDDSGESATCDIDCTLRTCGDSTLNPTAAEQCDTGGESPTCDADCTLPVCGDNVLNLSAGESCETMTDTAQCDADCTLPACGDSYVNSAAGEACDQGPTGGSGCDADCTLPLCGDGVINTAAGEVCDDGNTLDDDGCSGDCAFQQNGWSCSIAGTLCEEVCGDSIRVGSEQCDDGGPSVHCTAQCTVSYCGDGIINPAAPEACDEGTSPPSGGCSNDCATAFPGWTCLTNAPCFTTCGDGVIAGTESCDDGGESVNCNVDCTPAACGDGLVNANAGENCDDGNTTPGDGCSDTCQREVGWSCSVPGLPCATTCGDGIPAGTEECDDASANSDTMPNACRSDCARSFCGDGVIDDGETCDDGPDNSDQTPDACRSDCTQPICGDGVRDPVHGEGCDDGNNDSGDGCAATCISEQCGNGSLDPSEECDDGVSNSNIIPNACRNNCLIAFCGDGVEDSASAEECDQGRSNSDVLPNLCRTNCLLPRCGDGVVDAGEACEPAAGDSTCTAECRTVGISESGGAGCRTSTPFPWAILFGLVRRRRRQTPAS